MLTGSAAVIKYLLFIFNFIFVITGIAILSVGAYIQAEYMIYEGLLNNNYYSTPALFIAIGVIIFVVAFFGCCGSIKENYCMVLTFATLMIIIFILELSAGIAGYALRNKAEEVLRDNMKASMADYYNSTNTLWTGGEWDDLQTTFECCGVDSPDDWLKNAPAIFNETISVPQSCCNVSLANENKCNYSSVNRTNIYERGCLSTLETKVRENAVTLGGAGIGIAVVQLLGVVLSCSLAKGIKQGYETV